MSLCVVKIVALHPPSLPRDSSKTTQTEKNEDRVEDHEKENWEREMLKTTFVHEGLGWRETGSNGGGNSQMHMLMLIYFVQEYQSETMY